MKDLSYAYLCEGELYLKLPGQEPRSVNSAFAEEAKRRMLTIQQKNAWKRQSGGTTIMAGALVWGQEGNAQESPRTGIVALAKQLADNKLLYAVQTDNVCGIFSYDPRSSTEQRLFHNNQYRVQALATHPERSEVLCSVTSGTDIGNMALFQSGQGIKEITEGDSFDSACSWIDGDSLVYQSSGIGRDAMGRWVALGPAALEKLDLLSGKITTLFSHKDADYLAPKVGPDGALHFIRRPYLGSKKGSLGRWVWDIALIPWRLLSGIRHGLSYLGARYSAKQLGRAKSDSETGVDFRRLLIMGNVVDAAEEREKARRRGEKTPAVVPPSWQLQRQRGKAGLEVLAKGVIAFDIGRAGEILFSNGSGIFLLGVDGQSQLVEEVKNADTVIVL